MALDQQAQQLEGLDGKGQLATVAAQRARRLVELERSEAQLPASSNPRAARRPAEACTRGGSA
jgi:hypothetical protein